MTVTAFDTVLIANRGEIAVRIIRTLRRLGMRSVAVYSDADRGARHVAEADTAVRIGPASPQESYLTVETILRAAIATGAGAIHPGYGFLSENAALAGACAEAGIVFIGPRTRALELMGDKIRAKDHVATAGVPVIESVTSVGRTDPELVEAATSLGFPLLIKPSAGGGGKGMYPVHSADELAEAIASARRVASAAFGDDTLLIERLIATPRHIEVQLLADTHGSVIHLGERECSVQRRHQKVIEEAPSPLLDAATRDRIGEAAKNAKLLDSVVEELRLITGQQPVIRRAKKAISNFSLREGMPVGASVTLRRERMWEFLDRFINVSVPRIRDFRGLPTKSFDGRGNYTIGIKEQLIFPEIDYDKVQKIHGMDITFVTTANRDDEGMALLRELGMPFRGEVPVTAALA